MPGAPPFALVGPTASGKTDVAIALARQLDAEIVSVDSMLVYRGMDVGTAKPTAAQRALVPHHLIDVADPGEPFSVARYQALGRSALQDVAARGRRTLLTGGSGLYLRALVDDLRFPGTDAETRRTLELEGRVMGGEWLHARLAATDPAAAAKIAPSNLRRTVRALEVAAVTGAPFSTFAGAWERYPSEHVRAAGVDLARDVLARRIEARVQRMLASGWLQEVRDLARDATAPWLTSTQAIGYAELARHLQGRMTLEDAVELIVKRTRHLARRQMAWFRRDPRIHWFPVGDDGAVEAAGDIRAWLEDAA
jgi:tRNA dimethylallyltransferase